MIAFSHNVRLGLRDGIDRALADPNIKSIVITGKDKFLAGANIKEFAEGSFAQGFLFS